MGRVYQGDLWVAKLIRPLQVFGTDIGWALDLFPWGARGAKPNLSKFGVGFHAAQPNLP